MSAKAHMISEILKNSSNDELSDAIKILSFDDIKRINNMTNLKLDDVYALLINETNFRTKIDDNVKDFIKTHYNPNLVSLNDISRTDPILVITYALIGIGRDEYHRSMFSIKKVDNTKKWIIKRNCHNHFEPTAIYEKIKYDNFDLNEGYVSETITPRPNDLYNKIEQYAKKKGIIMNNVDYLPSKGNYRLYD